MGACVSKSDVSVCIHAHKEYLKRGVQVFRSTSVLWPPVSIKGFIHSISETGHDALMNLREVIDILQESELRINDSL